MNERSLEIEMHDKINRITEILSMLKELKGGGGSSFVLERSEISDGKITADVGPLWEICLKTDKVWVIIVPRR